ncbi:DNA-binding SARP family transcriptional activator [Streptosporangium becharense]|uniref:DNA-binding SARP family transcriptional activator n=1 Tax=Streptosporangium becharense TaxID=1816182 RepID=A0A7W9MEE2_9ACTN|nr:BTAD domain-containing putative transcriptional regulator [Streptosporangium becharense]MBB2913806.1 DNA-binding SARP family transcriptional activator [Streptosporangium becharense]MBB5817887.1 DNA-binding SARP family transcriptional activator [Streptosporangium becharense]
MRFRVLGPLEAHDDEGGVADLGGRRPRTVLARLLVAQGTVVSTDTLIDDLYGSAPPASALPTLQSYISNLRRVIEPGRNPRTPPRLLIGRPPGYLLATTDVDEIRFTELVNRSEFCPPGEVIACLDKALGLWRGTPYGEFADEPWAVTEVNRLRELRLVAIERRAQALLTLGRPQAVILQLKAETAANPLRERLWCLFALALYRTGRQADALAALRTAGDLLAEQLGLDPGPELQALKADILRQVESLEPAGGTMTLLSQDASAPRRALHGREGQLAELKRLPIRAAADGVTVAAVSGEPGMGKTCLLEAFREHCADLGYLVLWGRCHDTQGVPPLWPWLQVLGALAQRYPPSDRKALAGLLDDREPSGATEEALLRRNQAIAQWLATAAREQPLVIVVDDLHWADPASLELLRDVIVLVGGMVDAPPLTLVTAFRDTPAQHEITHGSASHDGASGLPADELLARLAGYGLVRLALTGLETREVRAVAGELGVDLDDDTAHVLTLRTGGNPFFVQESVRLLAQGHALDTVPDAVAKLIRQRLTALGPRVEETLRIAAVVGRDCDPAIIAAVGHDDTYALLDQAVQAGLLVSDGGRVTFVHDLVRETLVSGIPPLRKAMIHREVMTRLSSRPGTEVTVIAHHAVEAGPTAYAEAAHWARAAAEQAGLRLAYEEAATWWKLAIKAHDGSAGDPVDHVELLLRQVDALLKAGDPIGARLARSEAIRAADRAGGGPELTLRALTSLDAPAFWPLRNPYDPVERQLVHRFEAALRELPETDSPERVRLLGGLAQELYDGIDDPRCHPLSAEAVAMARRLDDPHLLMWALNARYLSVLHSPLERMKVSGELEELAGRAQTPGFELLAHMMHTHNRLEMFDLPGADAAAARCDAILERAPLPWPRFQHTVWRANRLVLDGRFDDAETLYHEADRQAERLGVWHARQVADVARFAAWYHQGRLAESEPLVDAIAGSHPSLMRNTRILQLCAQGRVDEAWETVGDSWSPPPQDWAWPASLCLQGSAQATLGCEPGCRESYAVLLPYSGRIAAVPGNCSSGPVDWYLALLASAVGDHDAARRHLVLLERLAERNGLTWWRGRAQAALEALPTPASGPSRRRAAGEPPGGEDRPAPPDDENGDPGRSGAVLLRPRSGRAGIFS